MRTRPDYINFDGDHVIVRVDVSVPWRDESLCYQHALDAPGLREEFGPLPEVLDPFDYHRRSELMQKRREAVDMVAKQIAHSILNALSKEPK